MAIPILTSAHPNGTGRSENLLPAPQGETERVVDVPERHRSPEGCGLCRPRLCQSLCDAPDFLLLSSCTSYRLEVADGDTLTAPRRIVWSNRVYATPEGDHGARKRLQAWAAQYGYRVVEAGQTRRAG